jgi:alkylation response protein AidB-like acyl-CoA dehydrogenase
MHLSYEPSYESLRGEVRAFLAERWRPSGAPAGGKTPPEEIAFRREGIARGYVCRRFPRRYGGSEQPTDVRAEAILQEEYARAGAPREAFGVGPAMLAPTLLEHGSEELKQRFLPGTLDGSLRWCQGYSEPGAGSDLASLTSRAERDGDEWRITGHKIWTSSAQIADYLFGLFRCNPQSQRHAGLAYLLVDMRQPEIRVRPLRQLTGGSEFNEVFFDGARTPLAWTVGEPGRGWEVSRSTLRHERDLLGHPRRLRESFDALVDLARETAARSSARALGDGALRQRLAELEGYVLAQECSGWRQLSAAARGEESSTRLAVLMNKLYSTQTQLRLTRLATELLGGDALLAPSETERGPQATPASPATWTAQHWLAIATAIAGGSSNIQRNLIGERGLGLPRDRVSTSERSGGARRG